MHSSLLSSICSEVGNISPQPANQNNLFDTQYQHHSSYNRLHLGDCIQRMKTMASNSIDLIVTDPPYLVNYHDRLGRKIIGDNQSDWLEPAFAEIYRLLRPHHFAISFYGWNHVDRFMTAWRKAGFRIVGHFVFAKHYASKTGFTEARHECAYLLAKGNPNHVNHALPDVMPWGKYTGNRYHPTQKPLDILMPLIKAYSDIGDVVLDPFAGSASTLIAAHLLHRAWIGIELDNHYHQIATKRLHHFMQSHSQQGEI
jgi:adenine-specific DNA-methyltransferase